ncbi:pseudouridine synthase [Gonapodya prolifera JEL478]|uniref:Pseudouridine synthase n=1 Tax=Gonapodya prolifera (strain JEL478) TaxID=1344416 RepID=A0A139A8V4_GONPJ|nr:pseudouridine synthase [Gonapodya prolifera JEL478]|eukprot:KXS12823.1 pseudouridine synthase [Gonapodya prolifera JEL478]
METSVPPVTPGQSRRRNHSVDPTAKKPKRQKRETDAFANPFWPGSTEDPEYFFDGGLRKVKPYFWTYNAYVKKRWMGRTLIDVFVSEFKDSTEEYYRKAIGSRLIVVNGKPIQPDYVLRDGDRISHSIHRHEPPVTAQPIEIVDTLSVQGVVVISKPAGLTVHSSGRYHQNTLLHILRREYGEVFGDSTPQLVNRLDRLTSGLMLIASTVERCREMERALRSRSVRKEYVCRVLGVFPETPITVDKHMLTVSHKLALNSVADDPSHPDAKHAVTEFERVSTNGFTSVVRARPRTGRTHQIRVHLQWLGGWCGRSWYRTPKSYGSGSTGFPIANDPLYCNSFWTSALSNPPTSTTPAATTVAAPSVSTSTARAVADAMLSQSRIYEDRRRAEMERRLHAAFDAVPDSVANSRTQCEGHAERGGAAEPPKRIPCMDCVSPLPDPVPDLLQMWLHAYEYENVPGEVFVEEEEVGEVGAEKENDEGLTEGSKKLGAESLGDSSSTSSVITDNFKLDTHPWKFWTRWPVWAQEDFEGDREIVERFASQYGRSGEGTTWE